ncbi:hypothetical protein C8N47_11742 [Mangrovibacterium marinum]|uniref:Uncharacterized protein n=1 Tax=Mangrovibacterium marinum TaxID=1639118 RepID=A0A2T5BYX3_9BACT|nr:hypothetical protein C8N47_11742 [Mangrovibacterium marinum]
MTMNDVPLNSSGNKGKGYTPGESKSDSKFKKGSDENSENCSSNSKRDIFNIVL